jgi:electron transport complex protein RnfD
MIESKITVSTAPFIKDKATTPGLMYGVLWSLLPAVLASIYYFGLGALLVMVTAVTTCLVTEWVFNPSQDRLRSLKDGSALITGLLLAMTLPPGFPLWMVCIGSVAAIGLGKSMWGGLGQNVFNPALLGRAFLQAAFPTAITTWSPPDGRYLSLRGTNAAFPFLQAENVDAVTTATPLARMKFDHASTGYMDLITGNTAGSIGETCALLLVMGGLYLLIRKIINWRIPLAILLSVALFSGIFYLLDPGSYPSPGFMLLSGGLLLGTFYMATDPVSSPISNKGCWIFGAGIGVIIVLIRNWGGLPEGVMYAILLMNAATPLINRFVRIRTFGYS